MATFKFIHSADWQLGKPFRRFPQEVGAALGEARLDAIDRLAEVASSNGAAHVLVAGDVFDNVEPGDRVVTQALSRMERARVTWWLMPGNHDHARPGGLWERIRRLQPSGVRIVDTPEAVEMADGAWLLPAPLEHRRTVADPTAAMTDMATPPGALRVGMAHGSITEFGATGESTNLIPPDRARLSSLDYLALGDWHGHMTIGDRTAYSGTPEVDRFGRDAPGSSICVTLRSGEPPQMERIQTGRYQWLSRRWDVASIEDLEREIAALGDGGRLSDVLLSLKLTGAASLSDRIAITSLIGGRLAHELRHLDLDADGLVVRPTPEDIAEIDIQGALAAAASSLRARLDAGEADAQIAGAALERLYVEATRFNTEGAR